MIDILLPLRRVAVPCHAAHVLLWLVASCCCLPAVWARAAEPAAGDAESVRLINPRTERWQFGVVVRAGYGPVTGLVATLPVPRNWPEQDVQVLQRDISRQVKSARFREIDDAVRQLVVTIPRLRANEEARAVLTLEITRRDLVAPEQPEGLQVPRGASRSMAKYLRPSPYIESDDRRIAELARQAVADVESGWKQAERIYDSVRAQVQYRFDEQIKSARTALDEGHGDCEELSSLFIAMCRSVDIPARLVWVRGHPGRPDHCYPEFYLVDGQGRGHWLPCQAAGTRSFGAMAEARPILQKGDHFRLPGQRAAQRYVYEQLSARNAAAPPQVQWVRQPLHSAAR